jgi:hypothetical protein
MFYLVDFLTTLAISDYVASSDMMLHEGIWKEAVVAQLVANLH